MLEIPTGHLSPQCFASDAISTYIYQTNQSQKGDARQLEAMLHTTLIPTAHQGSTV